MNTVRVENQSLQRPLVREHRIGHILKATMAIVEFRDRFVLLVLSPSAQSSVSCSIGIVIGPLLSIVALVRGGGGGGGGHYTGHEGANDAILLLEAYIVMMRMDVVVVTLQTSASTANVDNIAWFMGTTASVVGARTTTFQAKTRTPFEPTHPSEITVLNDFNDDDDDDQRRRPPKTTITQWWWWWLKESKL